MPVRENAPLAALLIDAGGQIVSWNAACEHVLGIGAADALRQPLTALLSERSRQHWQQRWSAFPSDCDAAELEFLRADGSVHSIFLTLLPQFGHDGALSHVVAMLDGACDESDSEAVGRMPLSTIIDVLPGTFYVLREDGSFALWNRTLEEVTAMTPEELRQANAVDLYHLAEKRLIAANMRNVFDQGTQAMVEANYLDKHGKVTPYLLCGARISCRGRHYLCGMGLDISERRAQEDRLRLRERALHATSSGLVISRCAGRDNPIEYANPAFERITGYSAAEAIGRDARFMGMPGMDEDEREQLRAAVRERREVNVVFRNRRRNGEIFWNDLTITPVSDTTGKVTHFIGVINDVTAVKQRTAHLEHEVNHDALTGLANRTLLWDRLEQALHMAQRNKSLVATVLVDLNGFKQINDSYGHEAGDQVLRMVARRLQSSVRESDTVARLSGDEFVLVLVNQPSLRYTLRMIERLRVSMSQPVSFDNTDIAVGGSIGVSVYPHDGGGALDLVRAADVAMYHAKAAKTGEVHFFSADMKSTTQAKQKLDDGMRGALERHELFLLYQPKICLRSGRIQGLEALLRWRHPELGVLAPASFLPEAEESGMIVAIGKYVLDEACAFMQRMDSAGFPPLPVALNASVREFSQPRYVEHVACILAAHRIAPARLELELREESLNANPHLSVEVVSQLHELGVLRSVDAFGDSLSNLNFLHKLPLTHVKLAKVAVHQITADARSGALAKALIDVGHDLGARVIAKGVENRLQMESLRANHCDELQGTYFSAPLAEHALHDMLVAAPAA
ncbi:EAL domain-containing protein [Massilia atriviolacea]|uniref:Bifunctional diguanylate cyclase/phosphodiesterase n=1 Tax=Massilia atriviolacea TaxID=2495579 RepID=A0A430HHT7_9BURK|nr:bifunctional diguanylate cyclase/phosphodiesterase [Massilia atriviolacea]RSZ57069.1 bifunctional diguanylate cyclase/phosphodiesterase [Massilia atriviolacea]